MYSQTYITAWKAFLGKKRKALIFDTETSGYSETENDILSLSWQIIDLHTWDTSSENTMYFPWPENRLIDKESIAINGLTKSFLESVSTQSRQSGILAFMMLFKEVDIVVAHNFQFDWKFICATAFRLGMAISSIPCVFDTMLSTKEYCQLPSLRLIGKYKYPKLKELANILQIDDSCINYHQSCADVELTKLCFFNIVKRGIVPYPGWVPPKPGDIDMDSFDLWFMEENRPLLKHTALKYKKEKAIPPIGYEGSCFFVDRHFDVEFVRVNKIYNCHTWQVERLMADNIAQNSLIDPLEDETAIWHPISNEEYSNIFEEMPHAAYIE